MAVRGWRNAAARVDLCDMHDLDSKWHTHLVDDDLNGDEGLASRVQFSCMFLREFDFTASLAFGKASLSELTT